MWAGGNRTLGLLRKTRDSERTLGLLGEKRDSVAGCSEQGVTHIIKIKKQRKKER